MEATSWKRTSPSWSVIEKNRPDLGRLLIHVSKKRHLGKSCTGPGFRAADDVDYFWKCDYSCTMLNLLWHIGIFVG
jgi:hypothetical protein